MEIKYELQEFFEIIKGELMSYEDGEQLYSVWFKKFSDMLNKNEISNVNYKKVNNVEYFVVYDELEIFAIVEEFVEAYDDNSLNDYFNTFK